MKSHYDKQPIPVGEQINLLESKGMEFYDRAFATRILSIIGYYRFSGYAYPFRNEVDNSGFNEDTSFEKIYSIYEFDRSLKSILFSYLGRIEIAFRTLVIDRFSVGTGSSLWYTDIENVSARNFLLIFNTICRIQGRTLLYISGKTIMTSSHQRGLLFR